MKRSVLALAALSSLALSAASSYRLFLNGQPAGQAIVVNGETYIPLKALRATGATSTVAGDILSVTLGGARPTTPSASAAPRTATAAGGANQIAALEGCIGETLFNGIWRVKVVSLQPAPPSYGAPGWTVNLEVRNGARQTTSLMSTGFGAGSAGSDPALVLPDGNTLKLNGNDFLGPWSRSVLQGGVMTFPLRFYFPQGTTEAQVQRPTKFILQINPKIPDYVGVKYSVPDPSLRVRLDCQR